MYRFIVLYVCIYVAPWSCEARHFVPLYVPTCSGMTIKLNLNLNLNLKPSQWAVEAYIIFQDNRFLNMRIRLNVAMNYPHYKLEIEKI